jgi:hypothetical protein
MKCQICKSDTNQFLDLGKHPPCDFLTENEFDREIFYPLTVYFCPNCKLVQLGQPVNQEALFVPRVGYHHIAALSSSFLRHLGVLAAETVARFSLTPNDLMVELGSNDGALLEAFQRKGIRILGVDPTDVIQIALDKNLPTIRKFFNEEVSGEIADTYGKAKIMTALNTFAHVSSLESVLLGIRNLLTDNGVFISENHYVMDLINELQYDFIYHEHSRYYSLSSLVCLFSKFDMDVFHIERIPTHSGSIRVFACKNGSYPISNSVTALLEEEKMSGLYEPHTYEKFADRVRAHQETFKDMLQGICANGKTIAGLTFPARAVTLLNSCGIGPETICYITEMSHLKIGKFSPGTHIKVVDQNILFGENAPDYGLLLSWHISDELIPRFRDKGFKGKFITPLPIPKVIA